MSETKCTLQLSKIKTLMSFNQRRRRRRKKTAYVVKFYVFQDKFFFFWINEDYLSTSFFLYEVFIFIFGKRYGVFISLRSTNKYFFLICSFFFFYQKYVLFLLLFITVLQTSISKGAADSIMHKLDGHTYRAQV